MRKSILIALSAVALASMPAICASTTTGNAAKTVQHAKQPMWRPETLSGTITMVDPALHLIVVQDSSGVPFDMVVNRSTRIESANGRLNLQELNTDLNKNASVKFVPEGRGDIAETIHVQQ